MISYAVIGYPIALGIILCVPQDNSVFFFPQNKSFIDHACSVKMAG